MNLLAACVASCRPMACGLCWLVLTTSETPDLTCYDFSYVSRRNRHPNIRGPALAPHKSAAHRCQCLP
jgi:hypothetical protein